MYQVCVLIFVGFFYSCNSLLNKLWSLVPSNTQNNSFIIMSAVSVYFFNDCFLFLLQVDRTISPIDLQGHCIFFSFNLTHHTLLDSWIFKCIVPSIFHVFPVFLYHKIFRSWLVSIFVYLPDHFSDASPSTEVTLSYK